MEQNELNAAMASLKENLKTQLAAAYKDGMREGAVMACAILYDVLSQTNLSKDHGLFLVLKELAQQNGCNDLTAKVALLPHQETLSASIDNE